MNIKTVLFRSRKPEDSIMSIQFKSYTLIVRSIETGLKLGYNRAHKHTDTPSEEIMIHEMSRAIMNALEDIIKFEEE